MKPSHFSVLMVFLLSTAYASDFPRVDSDIKAYDEHVAALNAAFDSTPPNPTDIAWVRLKLGHMVEVDQYMRNFIMNTAFERQYSDVEKTEFQIETGPRWAAVDDLNTNDLKSLLKIFIWFKISDFGEESDSQAWLLAQHADRDPGFQKQVLEILGGLWRQGETNPRNYAYLHDRVASSWADATQRKAQRYGTQGMCSGPGTWKPLPYEDPDNLDQRRKDVGLEPEADYMTRFKDICHEDQRPKP